MVGISHNVSGSVGIVGAVMTLLAAGGAYAALYDAQFSAAATEAAVDPEQLTEV